MIKEPTSGEKQVVQSEALVTIVCRIQRLQRSLSSSTPAVAYSRW